MKKLQQLALSLSGAATGLALSAKVALAATGLKDVNIVPGTGFATDFGGLMNGLISFVMVIAAVLVFFYLIWGGIEWITSGGDKGKTESARNKITSAVIGLIVIAASYAILTLALNFLGFTNLNDVFDQSKGIDGK
ncbi:MAG TPA: hypothetical protein DEP87_02250 [Candidatus Pacebacteria bacterium]|nr:hypothetical protein [Candidatus Paceibacterota bacterium]